MAKVQGPEFLRYCIPIIEVLRDLGGSGRPAEVTDVDTVETGEDYRAALMDTASCKSILLYRSGDIRVAGSARPFTVIENNLETDRDPGFTNPANFDFSFPEDSWLYEDIPGFEPIPFDKIGRLDG